MKKNLFVFNETVRNAFDNDEVKFGEFNQLMLDYAHNDLDSNITKKQANAKIVEKLRMAIGCTSESSPKEVRRAIRRNPALAYELIEDTVQNLLVTGWQTDPFFQKLIETRHQNLHDKNEFYIPDESVLSVMKVSGNHHSIIRQRLGSGRTMSLPTYWVGMKVYAEYERLLTNLEDFSTFINKIYEAYDNYVKQTIYDTFVEYSKNLSTDYKKTGTLTAANLRELCDFISRITDKPVIIMGTRSALRAVTALQNAVYVSDTMKQEHYNTGMLGMWEGFELMEIPQATVKNDIHALMIPNNMIWVMPMPEEKFIKVINEGDTQVYQVSDPATNADMTYSYEIQTKLGVGVIMGGAYGVYDIADGASASASTYGYGATCNTCGK